MRAAIIGSSNLSLNGIAERNVIQMAEILSNQGYEVTIFTPPDNEKNIISNKEFIVNSNIFRMDLFARKTLINLTGGRSTGLIGLFSFDLIYKQLINYDLYYFASPDILFARMAAYFYRNNMHPEIILGAVFGQPYFGRVVKRYGGKFTIAITTVASTVFFGLMLITDNVYLVQKSSPE